MRYKVIILEEAKSDFRETFNWYKNINPKLSKRFYISFKESLNLLKNNPLNFQLRYDENRIIVLKTFPHLIHFSIEGNTIIIKAIYHSSRDSKLNLF
ncbi:MULTISPECIES: type II toxin-antitoxin system RelE/ParE family toxin [Flavobacterium]|jgi:plasmid stabilization system protein ParE|uniref:Type II toxin-antitoxin system RelE/ParE family toxin n=1 Tax=Flavobacterium jumunjinense TaxID=998845 RepID=A0ABV5GKG7_9FLAO|nr:MULTISPECIES: type II toxin-antitoxin system RelE/ParE family toxin [Flavobacterium]